MSFTEEKREWIKKYMLEKIRQDDGAYAQKTMENFEISITTVKRYLKECVEQKIIVPNADKECGYCLITVEEEWEVDLSLIHISGSESGRLQCKPRRAGSRISD